MVSPAPGRDLGQDAEDQAGGGDGGGGGAVLELSVQIWVSWPYQGFPDALQSSSITVCKGPGPGLPLRIRACGGAAGPGSGVPIWERGRGDAVLLSPHPSGMPGSPEGHLGGTALESAGLPSS